MTSPIAAYLISVYAAVLDVPLFKFGGHIYYGKGDQPLTFVISILE